MKPLRTWIVVADGAHAKFLHYGGRKTGAKTIEGHVFAHSAAPTHDLGRDRPPRTTQSKGLSHHTIAPRVDLHEQEEEKFLQDVMRQFQEAFEGGAFEDVILIAPPKALGIIRKILPERIQAHVSAEIDRDFTRYADQEIGRRLNEHFEHQLPKTA